MMSSSLESFLLLLLLVVLLLAVTVVPSTTRELSPPPPVVVVFFTSSPVIALVLFALVVAFMCVRERRFEEKNLKFKRERENVLGFLGEHVAKEKKENGNRMRQKREKKSTHFLGSLRARERERERERDVFRSDDASAQEKNRSERFVGYDCEQRRCLFQTHFAEIESN